MTTRRDLETYEASFQRVFVSIATACDGGRPWLARVNDALAATVELLAADPALAHVVLVETLAHGPEARRLHDDALDRLAKQLDAGRELPMNGKLSELVSLMAVGSVFGLIFKEVLAGRAEQLPALLPDLTFTLLVPYLGPQAAAAEMRRAEAQRGM
jgi:hypothetical protein